MQALVSVLSAYAINALWLLPIMVLATESIMHLLRGVRAKIIHRIWIGCLMLSLTAPCLPFLHNSAYSFLAEKTYAIRDLIMNPQGTLAREAQLSNPQPGSFHGPQTLLFSSAFKSVAGIANGVLPRSSMVFDSIALLYLATVFFALSRMGVGLWRTRGLLQSAQRAILQPECVESWKSCQELFGQEHIELLSTNQLSSPATMNWPRPVILLPNTLQDAPPGEMIAVFCHELAHIRRRDFFLNLIFEFLGLLLFFHPAFHWIRKRIQETRELACDDIAAEAMDGRQMYARNLLRLTQKMRSEAGIQQPNCTLGIFEGEILEKRIMNLLGEKSGLSVLRLSLSLALGVCLLLASCVIGMKFGLKPLFAQAATQTDHAPAGWFFAGEANPENYRTGVDNGALHDSQPSAYLQSVVPDSKGFGTVMQTISTQNYTGKRVRLRASVKAENVSEWAGLWMRVDKGKEFVAFDNMQNRAIRGTQPWKTQNIVLDVPQDATSISFGNLAHRNRRSVDESSHV